MSRRYQRECKYECGEVCEEKKRMRMKENRMIMIRTKAKAKEVKPKKEE